MIECDICLTNKVVKEAIFDDGKDHMVILSLCADPVCESKVQFTRISNYFSLDNTDNSDVE